MTPLRSPKAVEVKYRRKLLSLVNALKKDTLSLIGPILKQFQSEYVNDAYAQTLEEAFDRLRKAYENIDKDAKLIASSFVEDTNSVNRKQFYAAMENAVGVSLERSIQNEGLSDILVATTRENVSLIKSIPAEYLKSVESIVFTGTTQGSKYGSLIQQIQKAGGVSARRAKLIARDQSSKINSAITQQRAQSLGVEEYIWRTAGDERVRDTHKRNNGKVFRWDKPPKETGHPGTDIQCRCVAQPIIKI